MKIQSKNALRSQMIILCFLGSYSMVYSQGFKYLGADDKYEWNMYTANSTPYGSDLILAGGLDQEVSSLDPLVTFKSAGQVIITEAASSDSDVENLCYNQDELDKHSLIVYRGAWADNYTIGPKSKWADYVLEDDYNLRPLSEVKKFINGYGYLPGMPNGDQIKKRGYELHEMNVNFLEKIEELTLYIIEQQEMLDEFKNLLIDQQIRIDDLTDSN